MVPVSYAYLKKSVSFVCLLIVLVYYAFFWGFFFI
jgi:hypothetical protein